MRPKIAVQNGDTFLVVGRLLRQQLFLRRSPVRNSCVFSSATKRTKQILLSFSGSAGASADETCRFNRFSFIRCLHWSNFQLRRLTCPFEGAKYLALREKCNLSSTRSTEKKRSRPRNKRGPDGRNQTSTGDSSFSQLTTMESPLPAALTSSSARQSNRCLHFCSS